MDAAGIEQPAIAFADFRADPEKHPLETPSGKIEIFSKQLFDLEQPEEIPAIPKYIQEWESPFGSGGGRAIPLQAIGHHTLHRVHSTHDNNDWLEEAFPQRVFINPLDAAARHPGWRPGPGLQRRAARWDAALPGHAPHHARRGGHPAGRLVRAG